MLTTAGELRGCFASESGKQNASEERSFVAFNCCGGTASDAVLLRSGSIVRAHHCCLRRVLKLGANTHLSLLFLITDKDVLGVFLGRFLLSRSSKVLRDASVAHASLIGGSARDVSGVLVACSPA